MTTKPTGKPPRAGTHTQGMTGDQKLKLTFARYAFSAFLALLVCTVLLANAEQAIAAGFTGALAGGSLLAFFRLLKDLSK